jgi:hypothetical protein
MAFDSLRSIWQAPSAKRLQPVLYHCHPHWQRTESHNRNFLNSDLQATQVRVHITFLHHAA